MQNAYSLALHPVFLYAIPLALVAFVLSWFLREVPLRTTSSVGIGEGLGAAATARSSVDEVERSLARLGGADLRRRGYERLTALAGLDLPAGSSWILTRLAKQGPVAGEKLARQANVTVDYGRPYVDRLVSEGMVARSNGTLVLTDSGHEAADRLFAARREGLRELLADLSPEEYAELGELLTKMSRALLGEDADRDLIRAEPAALLRPPKANEVLKPGARRASPSTGSPGSPGQRAAGLHRPLPAGLVPGDRKTRAASSAAAAGSSGFRATTTQ